MANDTWFAKIEDRWQSFFVGCDLDLEDRHIKSYVNKLNDEANKLYDELNKDSNEARDNLWQDLVIKKYNVQNGQKIEYNAGRLAFDQVWYCFIRLSKISKAIMTKGCDLYQNSDAVEQVLRGLDMLSTDYFSVKAEPYGNWWNWEIGIPQSFLASIMLLRQYISKNRLSSYLAPLNKFVASCEYSTVMKSHPKMTGANLLDKASSQAMIGVLEKNEAKLNDVLRIVKTVFVYANNTNKKITQQNDGFWRDGSYIQHAGIAYNGGYGAVLYSQIGIFLCVFNGTPWEFSYTDKCENIVYDSIFDGLEPLFYNGRFMDMTSGRGISRQSTNDKNRGVSLLSAIIPYVDSMPTQDMKNRLKSLIKYEISCDEDYFYDNCDKIHSLVLAKNIMMDDSIDATINTNFNKCFASMDKTVHARPDYYFALSMHSRRTYCHEIFNREGKTTGNISDGMTYIYDSDDEQFGDGFWGSVDMRRLPGTTAEYVNRKEGAGHFKRNPYKVVGMASLDSYGVSAMHLKTLGSGSLKNGTSAKKSWFMFDDEVVCLGSDITSFTGNYVETIIDNRKIDADAKDEVIINDIVCDDLIVSDNSRGIVVEDVSYVHLKAENGSQLGYTFPDKVKIRALKEIRKTNWLTIGNSDCDVTRGYATFLFDHGKRPIKASYAYAIHPNFTNEDTKAYANNQRYEILCQNSNAHIVRHKDLDITGACIWSKTGKYINGFKCNSAAIILVRHTKDTVKLSVSDPTQQANELIVSYDVNCSKTISKDKEVEILSLNPLTIKINTCESYGKTFLTQLKK